MTVAQESAFDPLTDTAGAAQYLPREATEHALAELEAALEADLRFIVLSGPSGMGKTLLLHVLEERQSGSRQVIFSPFLHFSPSEAETWLRGLLQERGFEPNEVRSPRETLEGEDSKLPLLLIVDDASSIPPETAADLTRILRATDRSWNVLLADVGGPRLNRVVEALGEPAARVRLDGRLSFAEAGELADRAIQRWADDSKRPPALGSDDLQTLFAAAEGNPRVLKTLMFHVEMGEPPHVAAAAVSPPHRSRRLSADPTPEGHIAARTVSSNDVIVPARDGPALSAAPKTFPLRARSQAAKRALTTSLRRLGRGSKSGLDGVVAATTGLVASTWEAARHGQILVAALVERLGGLARACGTEFRRVAPLSRRAAARGRRVTALLWRVVARRLHGSVGYARWLLTSWGDRLRSLASSYRRRIERVWSGARAGSKRPIEPVQSLTLLLLISSVALGFLTARLVVRSPAPAESPIALAIPSTSPSLSLSPAQVSAPPPTVIPSPLGAHATKAAPLPPPDTASLPPERPGSSAEPSVGSVAPAVSLHINARPWALIRLDGEPIGVTPLTRRETRAGRYELEAEFPDGRILKRVIDVGPESRFISLP